MLKHLYIKLEKETKKICVYMKHKKHINRIFLNTYHCNTGNIFKRDNFLYIFVLHLNIMSKECRIGRKMFTSTFIKYC